MRLLVSLQALGWPCKKGRLPGVYALWQGGASPFAADVLKLLQLQARQYQASPVTPQCLQIRLGKPLHSTPHVYTDGVTAVSSRCCHSAATAVWDATPICSIIEKMLQ
jgi:hypothetical protein